MSISVVIPCFNAGGHLAATLESAISQTLRPHEIVVVDDGSTDNSAQVAATFGPQVKVIRQENQGAAVARNRGVSEASGKWIAFLDSDDLWEPERLEVVAGVAGEADPDVVCVTNDLYVLSQDGSRIPKATPLELLDGDYHVKILQSWPLNPSCALVRRVAAERTPFPAGVRNVEDMQFTVLLRRQGRFLHVPQALTGYRKSPGQLTASMDHILIGIRAHLGFIEAHPELYSDKDKAALKDYWARAVVEAHGVAYWQRNNRIAREFRKMYYELRPGTIEIPELFRRILLPRWAGRLKDLVQQVVSGRG